MTDHGWGAVEQLEDDSARALDALVDALASLSGVIVTNHEDSADGWTVQGTIAPGTAGERSLSIISFVTDRRVSGVTLDVVPGGFVLRGCAWGPPIDLAWEIDHGRGAIREREARN